MPLTDPFAKNVQHKGSKAGEKFSGAGGLFPCIGKLPISTITPPVLLETLRKCEKRGAHASALTLRQTAGQVFRHGIGLGRCDRNPAGDMQGALKPILTGNFRQMEWAWIELASGMLTIPSQALAARRRGPSRENSEKKMRNLTSRRLALRYLREIE